MTSPLDEPAAARCPVCGVRAGLPIVYGYPGEGLWRAAERGEIHLGGCCVGRHDPTRHCARCGYEWRDEGESV